MRGEVGCGALHATRVSHRQGKAVSPNSGKSVPAPKQRQRQKRISLDADQDSFEIFRQLIYLSLRHCPQRSVPSVTFAVREVQPLTP
jgi:hypothetical protein